MSTISLRRIIGYGVLVISSVLPLTSQATLPPQVVDKAAPTLAGVLPNVMPAIVNVTVVGEMPRSALSRANDDNSSDNDDSQSPSPSNTQQNPPPDVPPSKQGQLPPMQRYEEVGSGVIVNAGKGYIVTNAHVLQGAKVVTITLGDGRRFKAKIVGTDRASDIAVLQINAPNLTQLLFGDSDKLQVGEFVAAIGNPFGLHQTVTTGVVSALHRSDLGIEGLENFIQTDASINPGNSGGALVDLKGHLVGINTALIGPVSGNVGIGLAIPSNMVKLIADELIRYGKVQRGLLGVFVQDLTPDLADALNISGKKGALITNVMPGSPAQKAGVQVQDVITRINDTDITSGAQLRNMMGLLPLKSKVYLIVLRKDKALTLEATLISPKEFKMATEPSLASFLEGVRLTSYDELIPDFGLVKGVVVLDVDETSDAWISGLRPGDMILGANGQEAINIETLLNIVKDNTKQLLLKVGRGQNIIFLVLNKYS